MRWQEGVEVDERLFIKVCTVSAGIHQFGVIAQRLTVFVEQGAQFSFTGGRFTQQSGVADLLDIIGLQINLNGEAVFEFIQLRRVQGGSGVVFGQGLLCCANYPDFAIAYVFQVFGQSVQVQNQVLPGADVLANLINNKNDVLFAGGFPGNVDHFRDPVIFKADNFAGFC